MNCTGSEERLADCGHDGVGSEILVSCKQAYVICKGKIMTTGTCMYLTVTEFFNLGYTVHILRSITISRAITSSEYVPVKWVNWASYSSHCGQYCGSHRTNPDSSGCDSDCSLPAERTHCEVGWYIPRFNHKFQTSHHLCIRSP